LGAGIIIGAFWAYEVLGWGGYWGWDPVENSSLVPWLTILALFHGLLVQRRFGSLIKTNFLLAIVSYTLVIYATFLTRSGVLADFSVHSFQDLGINMYLILFIFSILLTGLLLFRKRFKKISGNSLDFTYINKGNIILIGICVLIGSGIFILLGTSMPLISKLFGSPSQVGISYYNKVNIPFGIVMGLLLGLAPFISWKNSGSSQIKSLIIPIVLSGLSAAAAVIAGMIDVFQIFFIFFAAFALWGVGLMFIGIIISGVFNRNQTVVLTRDVPASALGFQLLYQEMVPQPNGKDFVSIRVSDEKSNYTALPRLYYSSYNRSMMREPDVKNGILQDIYLAPLQKVENQSQSKPKNLSMKKGEKKMFGDYEIYFKGFDMSNFQENDGFRVSANLEIARGNIKCAVHPSLLIKGNEEKRKPVEIPIFAEYAETAPKVVLLALNANDKSIHLGFEGLTKNQPASGETTDKIAVEISKKPFMSILWLSTILLTLGTIISLHRTINISRT
jgi:cytochrome c-type biogenesis protein CcmF